MSDVAYRTSYRIYEFDAQEGDALGIRAVVLPDSRKVRRDEVAAKVAKPDEEFCRQSEVIFAEDQNTWLKVTVSGVWRVRVWYPDLFDCSASVFRVDANGHEHEPDRYTDVNLAASTA